MKPLLTHPTEDLDLTRELPAHADDVVADLELDVLLDAMADGDRRVRDTCERALLTGATDPSTITHRQDVLADCIANPALPRELYAIATTTIDAERRLYFGRYGSSPDTILARGIRVMELLIDTMRRLRDTGQRHAGEVRSRGLVRLTTMLSDELNEGYVRTIEEHLADLRFRHGTLLSAQLGRGNTTTAHVLRRPPNRSWLAQLRDRARPGYTFTIPDRDESGFKALAELRGRATNGVANALAQSCDHILGFLDTLRSELALYLGAVNLERRLAEIGVPTCAPAVHDTGQPVLRAEGLYDPALALTIGRPPVGNDVDLGSASLLVVTGANQGGKSTLLRAIGSSQLLAQAGLRVPATAHDVRVTSAVRTHFPREEDAQMRRGKLDEELARMSAIVDDVQPEALVLCNESFSSTNEREGAVIGRHVVTALREAGVRVVLVTHMHELARTFADEPRDQAVFLRAQPGEDGQRPYRLTEQPPQPTSHGGDTYEQVFAEPLAQ